MQICGLQKLSLLDYPDKLAATVFFGGCNFRCPFCHNAALVTDTSGAPRIPEGEVVAFLERRRNFLDGVCVTGGEPLLQPELPDFLARVRAMGYRIKLDTNGFSPDGLRALIDRGLVDYVAMDVKNSLEKYPQTVGLLQVDLDAIRASARLIMEGRVDYEFRTTLVREFHQMADIRSIGEWLHGAGKYFLQKFEDSGRLIQSGLHAVDDETARQMRILAQAYFDTVGLRGMEK